MSEPIQAVYEKGVLHPLQPLDLEENQLVHIQILPKGGIAGEIKAAVQALVAAGLLTPPPGRSKEDAISKKERRELAERMGVSPGKPLSEIIIKERGTW